MDCLLIGIKSDPGRVTGPYKVRTRERKGTSSICRMRRAKTQPQLLRSLGKALSLLLGRSTSEVTAFPANPPKSPGYYVGTADTPWTGLPRMLRWPQP